MATADLIPANGVHITEADYPKGFYVAKYDAEGFTTAPRWFPTIEMAQNYALRCRLSAGEEENARLRSQLEIVRRQRDYITAAFNAKANP